MSADSPDTDEFQLRQRLQILGRQRAVVIGCLVVAVAAAAVLSFVRPQQYEASAEVLLPRSEVDAGIATNEQQNAAYLQQLVQTEIQVMRSRSVQQSVAAELGRTPDVTISAMDETSVVVIRARDGDPEEAAREADTYARTYVAFRQEQTRESIDRSAEAVRGQLTRLDERVDELREEARELDARVAATTDPAERDRLAAEQRQLGDAITAQEASRATRRVALTEQVDQLELAGNLVEARGARVVSEAEVPTSPVSPRPVRDISLAALLGLLVGVALAFVRDHLDDTVRDKAGLDQVTGGIGVLGLVPDVPGWRNGNRTLLVSVADPRSPAAEAYRGVRTSLQFLSLDRRFQRIQITSSDVGEGKSTTAANLAVVLARAGKRVVLVDCDLRRPRLHQFFGIDNDQGFTSVVLQDVAAVEAVVAIPGEPRLGVMPSGPIPPNPAELLSSRSAAAVLESLDGFTDFVVVDTPPLLPVADPVIIGRHVDATVLVATAGTTTRESLGRALEIIEQAELPLVGAVFNRVGGRNAYGQGYRYTPDRSSRRQRDRGSSPVESRPPVRWPTEEQPPGPVAHDDDDERAEVVPDAIVDRTV